MMRESRTRKLGQRACRKESGTRIVRVERGEGGCTSESEIGSLKVRLGVRAKVSGTRMVRSS